jgi:hypothetical protein
MALSQILTALKDPSARLTQHLRLKIGGSKAGVDVVDSTHTEAFNTDDALDLTVTVSDFVSRHATCAVEDGSGAYIEFSGGNIEIGALGTLRYQVTSLVRSGRGRRACTSNFGRRSGSAICTRLITTPTIRPSRARFSICSKAMAAASS